MRKVIPTPHRSALLAISFPFLIAITVTCPILLGQQIGPPSEKEKKDETVVLSVFEVKSEHDIGYRVRNSVATTGIAEEIRHTPLPITVITDEFLRDTLGQGFIGAVDYVSSITVDNGAADGKNSAGNGNSQPNRTSFRGQAINGTQRNGLLMSFGFNTENVDRVEIAKGPMAVFIGGATLGGIVNLITKKPTFTPKNEVIFKVGSHDTHRVDLDSNGPITKKLAYRIIASEEDKNTWRDYSHSHTTFINPQLLWRLGGYTGRIEAVHRENRGNAVSFSEMSTNNYQSAFDNPTTALLALGTSRIGRPYTPDEYRSRIGNSFGNWRQDIFETTGKWTTLGAGEGFTGGSWPSGVRANHFGPNAPYVERINLVESEHTAKVADWLELRVLGRYIASKSTAYYYNFPIRRNANGAYSLAFGNSSRVKQSGADTKAEGVFKKRVGWFDNTLLIGHQFFERTNRNSPGTWDASKIQPVAGSPNVFQSPSVLTGLNVYNFFDPRFHQYPDHLLYQAFADEVKPAGQASTSYFKDMTHADYAAANVGIWNSRLTFTAGGRHNDSYSLNKTYDRFGARLGPSTSQQANTDSYMYGVTLDPFPGISLYASYNQGETFQPGALVTNTNFVPGVNATISAQEAHDNPIPNIVGKGQEAGIKFDIIKNTLTGSVGYFKLIQGNVLVTDANRTDADPRNIGTEVDPNPATANPAVRAIIQWNKPINGNTSQGFESDIVWTPTRSYTLLAAASQLITNKLTVARPPSSDPTVLRDYSILNGRPLQNTPSYIFRAFQTYAFHAGFLNNFTIGSGVRHASSEMPNSTESTWGSVVPSYWVVDAMAKYNLKIGKYSSQIQLNVNNVTNKLYSSGGRIYSPPLEAYVTVRFSL